MTILIFIVLSIWLVLTGINIASFLVSIFKNKPVKPMQKIQKIEIEARQAARVYLRGQPELESIIKEISYCEKRLDDDQCKMRATILKAKLRLNIRNPVLRKALIDIVINKNNR